MTTMFYIARFDGQQDVYAYEYADGRVTEWSPSKSEALRFYRLQADALLAANPDWKSEPAMVADGEVA
jgi:hypothetical protein